MKEWNKPFMKVVVLDELLTDVICNSQVDDNPKVTGEGATKSSNSYIWDN